MARPRRISRKKRLRRTAEDARAAILDAAERMLTDLGPDGIRLKDVARAVGVSHPTVLHHFGSREALVTAVVQRTVGSLERDLVAELATSPVGAESVTHMLDSVARVLGPGGHARVVAWLALSGQAPYDGPTGFDTVARACHALRQAHRADCPPFEDSYFAVLMSGLALFGDAIAGPIFRGQEDPDVAAASSARFRAWLAKLLQQYLEEGGEQPLPTP